MTIDMTAIYRQHPAVERVEQNNDHRLEERTPLVRRIPQGSRGAEVGVFTGVFSEFLLHHVRPAEFTLVDAWDSDGTEAWAPEEGAPWAHYVDYGRLTYEAARSAAQFRAAHFPGTRVVTSTSLEWLDAQFANSLDWVYLDTTHHYEDTLAELEAIARVVGPEGLILGDDAWESNENPAFGVVRAIRDFTRTHPWEIFYLDAGQFALRSQT
jgi:SAM-dependent methyltransferase